MSQRVSKEDRILIRRKSKNGESIRAIAKDLKKSPTTVQRIIKSDSLYDKPRNPEGYPEIGVLEETIFFEMLRLSRYHYNKLIEYLEPIWPHLPTKANLESGQNGLIKNAVTGKLVKRYVSHKTVYSHIKRYAWGMLLKAYDRKKPDEGTVAIHRIGIRWMDKSGKTESRYILLLMERATGLLYAKTYFRTRHREVRICQKRFEEMYGLPIKSFHFVTETKARDNISDIGSYTSIIKKLEASKIDAINSQFNFTVKADMTTPSQEQWVTIPGSFANHHELNQVIAEYVNTLNTHPRSYTYHDSKVEMTPLNKLIKLYKDEGQIVSEKLTRQRIKL